MTLGIVLFAHGSRDPLWSKPIETIAKEVSRASPACIVRCAYLELMQPTLDAVITELAMQGVVHIQITPMFLGVGKHAKHDIPEFVGRLQKTYPNLKLELHPSIGEHPDLITTITTILTKSL